MNNLSFRVAFGSNPSPGLSSCKNLANELIINTNNIEIHRKLKKNLFLQEIQYKGIYLKKLNYKYSDVKNL